MFRLDPGSLLSPEQLVPSLFQQILLGRQSDYRDTMAAQMAQIGRIRHIMQNHHRHLESRLVHEQGVVLYQGLCTPVTHGLDEFNYIYLFQMISSGFQPSR